MSYHTSAYLFLFLPLALLAYQITPKKVRWVTLLAAGYVFSWMVSGKLVIHLIGTSLWSHYIGVWQAWLKSRCHMELEHASKEECANIKKNYKKKERTVLAGGIILLLAILGYLKYYNFFAQNMSQLSATLGRREPLQAKALLLPIGISFYTLQAIGYMVDVYWEKIPPERHPGKIALFLGFFPQIMEGPISMYSQTADTLWKGTSLKGEHLAHGSIRIFWGLFKKMIIADRLYVVVQAIFENYSQYKGAVVAAAAVAYTVQLYMEFSGSMDIVIGSGRMFGIILPENFRQPFFAKNASEFWRRWHITLGVWFKTYVFYPVSMSGIAKRWNRFGRKHLGKHLTKVGISAIALFPVWLCNGLWHGPRWSYIFYGMYYFSILMCGIMLEPVRNKCLEILHINDQMFFWKILQTGKTWIIIFVGELFFRANGLRAGIHMFLSIFRDFDLNKLVDGTLLNLGLDQADFIAIGVGCVVVALYGIVRERNLMGETKLQKLCLPVRWALYYGLILAVVIFGAYGVGYQQVDLIYAGF